MINHIKLVTRKIYLEFLFCIFIFFTASSCGSHTKIIGNQSLILNSQISNLMLSSLNSQIYINLVLDCNFEDIIYCAGTVSVPDGSGLSYSFESSCSSSNTTFNFLVGNCILSKLYRSDLYCLNLTRGSVFTILPDLALKGVQCI